MYKSYSSNFFASKTLSRKISWFLGKSNFNIIPNRFIGEIIKILLKN